ncbi:MAG: response regulator [Promethearchaeota archaeon]|nr:MAG: response regulator [Candidatus Lokiarchaeota archaeon]
MVKVLIVEDDRSLQRLYELMLTTFGFEVVGKASNGKEAVDLFQSMPLRPDIILMDYRMPVKNGIEASVEILENNSHTKIIFTSADRSIANKALSIGVTSFIEKPFVITALHKEIERVYNEK